MKKVYALGIVAVAVAILMSTFSPIANTVKVAETVPPTLNGLVIIYK